MFRLPFVKAALAIGLSAVVLALLISSARSSTTPISFFVPPASVVRTLETGNLLINPDFEDGYSYPLPCCNNIAVPIGWNIRWYTDTAVVIGGKTYKFKQPEVAIRDREVWPFGGQSPNVPVRINTGRYAVDAFAAFSPLDVSLYQQVSNIPIGAMLTGTAWLHAWASSCNPFPKSGTIQAPALALYGPNDANNNYQCPPDFWPMETNHMIVGIDPTGGIDPRSSTVVWNWNANQPAWWGPYDYYSSTVPAVTIAQAHTVTLFLRGVTQQPTKYDDVYFDTASLSYSFPLSASTALDAYWPLPVTATVSVQTAISLTAVAVTATDQAGDFPPLAFLDTMVASPTVTSRWQVFPILAGPHTFTLTANELVGPLVMSFAVPNLPFYYWQDRLLPAAGEPITEPAYITYTLGSPLALTNLTTAVSDPVGNSVVVTAAGEDFSGDWHWYHWGFAPQLTGLHTVTLRADEFTQPDEQLVIVASHRVYLPLVMRNG